MPTTTVRATCRKGRGAIGNRCSRRKDSMADFRAGQGKKRKYVGSGTYVKSHKKGGR